MPLSLFRPLLPLLLVPFLYISAFSHEPPSENQNEKSFGSIEILYGFAGDATGPDFTEHGTSQKNVYGAFGFNPYMEWKVGENVYFGTGLMLLWLDDPFSYFDTRRSLTEIDLRLRISFSIWKELCVDFLISAGPSLWSSDNNNIMGIGLGKRIGVLVSYKVLNLRTFVSLTHLSANVRPLSSLYNEYIEHPTIYDFNTVLLGLGIMRY